MSRFERESRGFESLQVLQSYALVAQLEEVSRLEREGCRFEPDQGYQLNQELRLLHAALAVMVHALD